VTATAAKHPRPADLARQTAAPATRPLNEFRQWLAEHHFRLVPYVVKLLRRRLNEPSRQDLDDLARCVEDVYLRCCQLYDPRRGWTFATYATKSMRLAGWSSWAREWHRGREARLSLDHRDPGDELETEGGLTWAAGREYAPALDARDLRRALRRLLPREEYLAVWLTARGWSQPEIGRRLRCGDQAISDRVNRARRRLVKHRARLVEGRR